MYKTQTAPAMAPFNHSLQAKPFESRKLISLPVFAKGKGARTPDLDAEVLFLTITATVVLLNSTYFLSPLKIIESFEHIHLGAVVLRGPAQSHR